METPLYKPFGKPKKKNHKNKSNELILISDDDRENNGVENSNS